MSTGLYSRLDQGLRGEWLGPQGRVNGMSLGYLTWLQLAVAGLGGSFSSMITPSFKKPAESLEPESPTVSLVTNYAIGDAEWARSQTE
jgi:hypothetical protein